MYWTFQIVGSLLVGLFLDYQGLSRRARGLICGVVLFLIMMGVWAGGFAFQLTFDRDYADPKHWTSPGFGGPFVLYLIYGMTDAMYQSYMYWLMGAMSNDTSLLARYAGFYKAMQSAGSAISFGIDSAGVPLRWACLISWLLLFVSFPLIIMVANQIKPTNINEEDGAAIEDKPYDESEKKQEEIKA